MMRVWCYWCQHMLYLKQTLPCSLLIILHTSSIYEITDGKDDNTCQASYAGLRINTGVLMSFTTSRGKKHWHTVKGWCWLLSITYFHGSGTARLMTKMWRMIALSCVGNAGTNLTWIHAWTAVQEPPLQILKQSIQKKKLEYWKWASLTRNGPEDGQHHYRKPARSFAWKCLLCNGGKDIRS
jgi:hypothetical protein